MGKWDSHIDRYVATFDDTVDVIESGTPVTKPETLAFEATHLADAMLTVEAYCYFAKREPPLTVVDLRVNGLPIQVQDSSVWRADRYNGAKHWLHQS